MCRYTHHRMLCGHAVIKVHAPCELISERQGCIHCNNSEQPQFEDINVRTNIEHFTYGPGICALVKCRKSYGILPPTHEEHEEYYTPDEEPFDMSPEARVESEGRWRFKAWGKLPPIHIPEWWAMNPRYMTAFELYQYTPLFLDVYVANPGAERRGPPAQHPSLVELFGDQEDAVYDHDFADVRCQSVENGMQKEKQEEDTDDDSHTEGRDQEEEEEDAEAEADEDCMDVSQDSCGERKDSFMDRCHRCTAQVSHVHQS